MTRLDLSGNPLGVLGPDHFVNLTSLRRLDLSNCQLKEIDAGAFRQLRQLTELNLSRNRLSTKMTKTALKMRFLEPVADTLEILKLERNDLELAGIVDGALERPLVALKHLTLGWNQNASTIQLGSEFRRNLINLKTLSFSGNRIDKIQFGSFQVLRQKLTDESSSPSSSSSSSSSSPSISTLEALDLSGCNLTYIHPDAFQFLPPNSFKHLNLSFNPLLTRDADGSLGGGHFQVRAILHGLEVVPSLESLDLSGLNLDMVTNETFDFLQSSRALRKLRLSHNQLVRFDDEKIGDDLRQLREIDLSHNYLVSVRGLDALWGLEEVG